MNNYFGNEVELRQKHPDFEREQGIIMRLFDDYLSFKSKVSVSFISDNSSMPLLSSKKYAFSNQLKEAYWRNYSSDGRITSISFKKSGELTFFSTNDAKLIAACCQSNLFDEIHFTDSSDIVPMTFSRNGDEIARIKTATVNGTEVIAEYWLYI